MKLILHYSKFLFENRNFISTNTNNINMKGTYLGEFEELVMLSVGALHPNGYGVAIQNHIGTLTKRNVTLSTVHAALHRLQAKGFLKSEFGEATKERGGKRKKMFLITDSGTSALRSSKGWRDELWATIPEIALSKL